MSGPNSVPQCLQGLSMAQMVEQFVTDLDKLNDNAIHKKEGEESDLQEKLRFLLLEKSICQKALENARHTPPPPKSADPHEAAVIELAEKLMLDTKNGLEESWTRINQKIAECEGKIKECQADLTIFLARRGEHGSYAIKIAQALSAENKN